MLLCMREHTGLAWYHRSARGRARGAARGRGRCNCSRRGARGQRLGDIASTAKVTRPAPPAPPRVLRSLIPYTLLLFLVFSAKAAILDPLFNTFILR